MQKSKSIFRETFGDTPLLKVIEFFLEYPDFDYTKSYVAKEAEISRITMEKIWRQLIKSGMIVKSRTLGKADMYKLNRENLRVKAIMKASMELSLSYLDELKRPKAVKARI